jgi:hypothetical protein
MLEVFFVATCIHRQKPCIVSPLKAHGQHWENGISFPWLCLKTGQPGPIPTYPDESCQLKQILRPNKKPYFRQLRIILSFLETIQILQTESSWAQKTSFGTFFNVGDLRCDLRSLDVLRLAGLSDLTLCRAWGWSAPWKVQVSRSPDPYPLVNVYIAMEHGPLE